MFGKESSFPATKDFTKVSVKSAQSDYHNGVEANFNEHNELSRYLVI